MSKKTQKILSELADVIEQMSKREWDSIDQMLVEISESEDYFGKEGDLVYEHDIQSSETTTSRWLSFFQVLVQLVKSDRTKSALRLCEHFIFNQAQTLKDLLCDHITMGSDQVAMSMQKSQAPTSFLELKTANNKNNNLNLTLFRSLILKIIA